MVASRDDQPRAHNKDVLGDRKYEIKLGLQFAVLSTSHEIWKVTGGTKCYQPPIHSSHSQVRAGVPHSRKADTIHPYLALTLVPCLISNLLLFSIPASPPRYRWPPP
jgi:hypothetical protein